MKQIGLAMQMYTDNYDGRIPPKNGPWGYAGTGGVRIRGPPGDTIYGLGPLVDNTNPANIWLSFFK